MAAFGRLRWAFALGGLVLLMRAGVVLAQSPLTVEYLGNEGFYLAAGTQSVLVDALFREGVRGYVTMPAARRDSLERAQPPFAGVDLVLATHVHADHFDPEAVGTHLAHNPRAVFISTPQAVARLREASPDFATIADRVRTADVAEGERQVFEENGVRVEALSFHHGRTRPIENLAFLVHLGGRTLLHVGDTEVTADDIRAYGLPAASVDYAFLPYWMLAYPGSEATVRDAIAPGTIVAMHLPPPADPATYLSDLGGFAGAAAKIEAFFPGTVVFRQPRERRVFE